MQIKACPSTAY